jgi:hypothetical protein
MISAETLAFLRGSQAVVTRKATTPFLSAFTTNADGETTATADAFLHVEGGTYNAMAKGVVIGQVSMAREDHGALSAATGLPVHNALDCARMPGLALMHVGAENAMAGKTFNAERLYGSRAGKTTTWLDAPPRHDLGVFERAADAARSGGGYVEPFSAEDLRMRAGFTAREQVLLFGSSLTIVEGPDHAQT